MKRNAFSIIFALIVTVLIATLGILGLKLSTSSLNTTTNEYINIQLDLYLNSTIELAILYIQRNSFQFVEGTQTQKLNPMTPIVKNIKYGGNGEYSFTYKMIPLVDPTTASESVKNTMILDVSGFVVNPATNQTFRVTKRQTIKP